MSGEKRCLRCHGPIQKLSGIVCANYGCRKNGSRVCLNAWHGSCYIQSEYDNFPVFDMKDIGESVFVGEDEEAAEARRFTHARNGDHFLVPFQCDECHFFNLKGRLPMLGEQTDTLLQTCIRRAILDSFWSRESATVDRNRYDLGKIIQHSHALGTVPQALPTRGPVPANDLWGMNLACTILLDSLRPGRNSDRLQFGSIRKLRSAYSNFAHTCEGGVSGSFLSGGGMQSGFITTSSGHHFWFRRFMEGCHRRMGDVWLPNAPITKEIISKALLILKEEIGDGHTPPPEVTACMLIAGFYGGLRGEEINRLHMKPLVDNWEKATNGKHPYIPLAIVGRLKGGDRERRIINHPLACKTKSGSDLKFWFQRLVTFRKEQGTTDGYMFLRKSGNEKARLAEIDVQLHTILRKVQIRYPKAIPPDEDIDQVYSIYQSLRRGSTAEAQNAGIHNDVIELNNRWRKHANSQGTTPQMKMLERYSDPKAMIPSLTRYSAELD